MFIRGGAHIDPIRETVKNFYGAKKAGGQVRVMKVITTRMDKGIPVADIIDADGNMFLQCRMMGIGGGGKDDFSYTPPSSGDWKGGKAGLDHSAAAEVIVAYPQGQRPHPFILGTLFNARNTRHLTTKKTGSRHSPGGSGPKGGQKTCKPLTGGGPMHKKLNGKKSNMLSMKRTDGGGVSRILVNYEGFIGIDTRLNPKDGYIKFGLGREACIRVSHSYPGVGSDRTPEKGGKYGKKEVYEDNQWIKDMYPVNEYLLMAGKFMAHYQMVVEELDRCRDWIKGIASSLASAETTAQTAKTAAESAAPGTGSVAYGASWDTSLQGAPWTAHGAGSMTTGAHDGGGSLEAYDYNVKANSWKGGKLAYKAEEFKSAAFVISNKNVCDPHDPT